MSAEACADGQVRRRGPAARARAAGPRRARPQVRRLRRSRGCRPGGAARGVRALAAGRHPGRRAWLADPDRRAAADRPVAQRAVPQGPGDGRRAAGAAGPGGAGRGRHVDRAVHVLPPGADAGLGDRPHAACGRRADDGRDRERVHGRRGDDGAAHLQGQAKDQGIGGAVPDAGRRGAGGEQAERPPRPLPHLQRGVHEQHRAGVAPGRAVGRGDPADADGAAAASRRRRGHGPARADAADRRAAARAHRRGRRADPAGGAGPDALGSGAHRRGDRARRPGARPRSGRRVPASGRDRRRSRPRRNRRRHRLAADPRPLRVAGSDDGQPDRDAQPGRRGGDGREPGSGPGPARHGRRAARRALPPRRGAGAPAGAGRRHGGGAGALPGGGRADDEPARAALPGAAGGAAQCRRRPRATDDRRRRRCSSVPTMAGGRQGW